MEPQQQQDRATASSAESIGLPTISATPEDRLRQWEARQARLAAATAAAERRENRKLLRHTVGRRYDGCTLDSFEVTTPLQVRVLEAILEYVSNLQSRIDDGEGLLLHGAVGTGKDHCAYAVCNAFIDAGFSVGWINGVNWFGTLRDNISGDHSEASVIAELVKPMVLCISDPLPPSMDKGDCLTSFQSSQLYRVLNGRYGRRRVTICTINVNDDREADRRLGEAIWDRLSDRAWKLNFHWPSYRRPAREVK